MISISGKYYNGKNSQASDAIFIGKSSDHTRIELVTDGQVIVSADLEHLKFSSRLADTPRYIYFPEGQKFETQDNQSVDELLKQFKKHSWLDMLYVFENRKRYVLIALSILILFIWGSVQYAVPFISKHIAFHLPLNARQYAGSKTLNFLDQSILKPSQLESAVHKKLLSHFQPGIDAHTDLDLKIYFRKGGSLGPNAFALPGGIIIFTDEMIQTAEHDDELLAVLLHEAGHIVHRHGMQVAIQDSLLGFLLLSMTGDVAGSSELFLGLPVLLTQMAYSRKFEHEADRYALKWLRQKSIPPAHFARLIERIDQKREASYKTGDKKWLNYLSSHPRTKERIKAFQDTNE